MRRFVYTVELHEAVWEVGGIIVQKQYWFTNYEDAFTRYNTLLENERNTGKIVVLNEIIYHLINEGKKVHEYSIFSTLVA